MRVSWLPDVLRAAGLVVEELPGWRGRGAELARVDGLVEHGFGARYEDGWTDTAFDRMLVSGRPDLDGPLSQLGLDRDGHFVMVADGKANHNGYGLWGNQSIGIEAYGKDRWTAAQLEAWPRGSAAILRHLGYGVDRDKAHRETDPRRKPDPVGIDMDDFRRRVAALITAQEDDMPRPTTIVDALVAPDGKGVWLLQYDGGIITKGGAPFLGSYPGLPAEHRRGERHFVAIEAHAGGYRLVADDGSLYRFAAKRG